MGSPRRWFVKWSNGTGRWYRFRSNGIYTEVLTCPNEISWSNEVQIGQTHSTGRCPMIDTLTEKVFPLVHAATHEVPILRRGRRTHISTLYRWTKTGCRGVKLDYVQCGATRCTSREALSRFFER